eukprot:gene12764-9123_t
MGNLLCSSIYYREPQLAQFRPLFEAFQLSSRDIRRLYEVFCALDVDESGLVSTKELFGYLDAKESTKFCDRVFTLFDEDQSGQIDFREFVVALWNYCTLSHSSLIIFAFDVYDTDETGELSPSEVELMLKDLYGENAATHAQAKVIRKELQAMDSRHFLTIDKFREFVRSHPALLFPAFQMQLALQQAVLGVGFWERCSAKRVRLSDGRRVRLEVVKSINTHDHMHRKMIVADQAQIMANDAGANEPFRVIQHPKKQMAAMILQATGTLHYRRGDKQNIHTAFLGDEEGQNITNMMKSYAQSKLQGLQPWRRHAHYSSAKHNVLANRKVVPAAAISEEQSITASLHVSSQSGGKDAHDTASNSPAASPFLAEKEEKKEHYAMDDGHALELSAPKGSLDKADAASAAGSHSPVVPFLPLGASSDDEHSVRSRHPPAAHGQQTPPRSWTNTPPRNSRANTPTRSPAKRAVHEDLEVEELSNRSAGDSGPHKASSSHQTHHHRDRQLRHRDTHTPPSAIPGDSRHQRLIRNAHE